MPTLGYILAFVCGSLFATAVWFVIDQIREWSRRDEMASNIADAGRRGYARGVKDGALHHKSHQ